MRKELRAGGWLTVAFLWFVILAVVGTAIWYFALPYFVGRERQVIVQSQGYVNSQITALRSMKADYDAVEVRLAETEDVTMQNALKAQQAGIVRQMKQIVDTIPGSVPLDIAAFLGGR